ncbi:MAG: hypothetical protein LH467_04680 [Gemmatimonadaceae bacterium]|nr:hypothetical protein [Gemmatimonadaceae bacterium]
MAVFLSNGGGSTANGAADARSAQGAYDAPAWCSLTAGVLESDENWCSESDHGMGLALASIVVSLAYALASYPLVRSLVLSWANPTTYTQAPMMQMRWGHLIFGAVFGMAYLRLTRERKGSA